MPPDNEKPFWTRNRYRWHCSIRVPRWLYYRKLEELEAAGVQHEDLPPMSNYAVMRLSIEEAQRIKEKCPLCPVS
jgi:hypothetical protein